MSLATEVIHVIAKIHRSYTEIVLRIFTCSDMQHISLTPDEAWSTEHFDIWNTILCQHIRKLQTFKKQSSFLAHPV